MSHKRTWSTQDPRLASRTTIQYERVGVHERGDDTHSTGTSSRTHSRRPSPFDKQHSRRSQGGLQPKRLRLGIAGVLLFVFALFFWTSDTNQYTPSLDSHYHNSNPNYTSEDTYSPRQFRLVVQGSQAGAPLCKSLVSAAILGFPPPVLLDHRRRFDDKELVSGGSQLAKIDSVLGYLESLHEDYDDDLVMIADGYDIWYQLRPSVLIERYHKINADADARIRRELGVKAVDSLNIRQTVIFSAQKDCGPTRQEHPACYAVPESSLPKDAYGTGTDRDTDDETNPHQRYRPRYLNSGSCLGPVAAVREVFRRAKVKTYAMEQDGSDQEIFGSIFGEQEFHRHVVKMLYRGRARRFLDWFGRFLGGLHSYALIDPLASPPNTRLFLPHALEPAYEMGIGLDYTGSIVQAAALSENQTAWISYGDKAAIVSTSSSLGIRPPRVGTLPDDIAKSLPPFYSPRRGEFPIGELPAKQTWADVSLHTNLWTGISPVAVHHNARQGGSHFRLHTEWPHTWYTPYLRSMLDRHALLPQRALALTYTGPGGAPQEWWGPTYDNWKSEWNGVWAGFNPGMQIDFEELCNGDRVWYEVLRDGRGPWMDPRSKNERPDLPPPPPPPPDFPPQPPAHPPPPAFAGEGQETPILDSQLVQLPPQISGFVGTHNGPVMRSLDGREDAVTSQRGTSDKP